MTFYFSPPYMLPAGNARASGYGITGTPSAMFGGTDLVTGGAGASMFNTYDPVVTAQMAVASPLIISAQYVLLNGQVDVQADISVDLATSGDNRQVMFFVTQAALHGNLNMVVAMLPDEPFNLTTPGESVSVLRSFPMDAAWNEPDMNIIVLVQDTVTKEVFQAGQAIPDYAGTVTIDCDPDGVEANWTLTGPGMTLSGQGDYTLGLFAIGTYTVAWADIPYWDTPATPQVQTLIEGGELTFTGAYTNGPFTAVTAGPLAATTTGAAVSLVDVDNDGDLDIHLTGGNGSDQMLRNDGAEVFTELAASPLATVGDSRGAAWADVNGDGNVDVCVTRINQANEVYFGDGAGGFSLVTTYPGGDSGPGSSAAWVDYNLDGLLDLAVVNEGSANVLLANQGEISPGILLFNNIDGAFSNMSNGSCVVWGDGDLNGRLDPFLVNQFAANVLFENTAYGFSDLTASTGLGDLRNGYGAAWGDYDNDGDFDLYVANDGQADQFYKCTGAFHYTQVTYNGLGDMGNGRGVIWADFDNDTFLDLYVARHDETDLFLLSDGEGNFNRVPVGPDEATMGSNAVACGDVNGDGRIDVVISREDAANVLFENGLGESNHWVQLHLTGSGTNTGAIGTRVVLTADGVSQTRLISPGSGYLSCSAVDPHFGLGAVVAIDQIDLYWPDGTHQVVGPRIGDRVIAITEGIDPVSAVENDETPRSNVLSGAYPNPFNPSTTISFVLQHTARARLAVYNVDGRLVRVLADETFSSGPHELVWNGTDSSQRAMASGTYLFRLTTADGFDETGRMVLVK